MDTLDFHAHILPVHIHLNRSAFNAGTHLASCPSSNPICCAFLRCRNVPRFHHSPIHHLISAFPSEFETINPQRRLAPLPTGALSMHIADSKDKARTNVERIVAGLQVLHIHRWLGL
jgi:hypothetical protein